MEVEILAGKIICLHFSSTLLFGSKYKVTRICMFLGKLGQREMLSFLRCVVNCKLNSARESGVSVLFSVPSAFWRLLVGKSIGGLVSLRGI